MSWYQAGKPPTEGAIFTGPARSSTAWAEKLLAASASASARAPARMLKAEDNIYDLLMANRAQTLVPASCCSMAEKHYACHCLGATGQMPNLRGNSPGGPVFFRRKLGKNGPHSLVLGPRNWGFRRLARSKSEACAMQLCAEKKGCPFDKIRQDES